VPLKHNDLVNIAGRQFRFEDARTTLSSAADSTPSPHVTSGARVVNQLSPSPMMMRTKSAESSLFKMPMPIRRNNSVKSQTPKKDDATTVKENTTPQKPEPLSLETPASETLEPSPAVAVSTPVKPTNAPPSTPTAAIRSAVPEWLSRTAVKANAPQSRLFAATETSSRRKQSSLDTVATPARPTRNSQLKPMKRANETPAKSVAAQVASTAVDDDIAQPLFASEEQQHHHHHQTDAQQHTVDRRMHTPMRRQLLSKADQLRETNQQRRQEARILATPLKKAIHVNGNVSTARFVQRRTAPTLHLPIASELIAKSQEAQTRRSTRVVKGTIASPARREIGTRASQLAQQRQAKQPLQPLPKPIVEELQTAASKAAQRRADSKRQIAPQLAQELLATAAVADARRTQRKRLVSEIQVAAPKLIDQRVESSKKRRLGTPVKRMIEQKAEEINTRQLRSRQSSKSQLNVTAVVIEEKEQIDVATPPTPRKQGTSVKSMRME
jgi:hypothetical protein